MGVRITIPPTRITINHRIIAHCSLYKYIKPYIPINFSTPMLSSYDSPYSPPLGPIPHQLAWISPSLAIVVPYPASLLPMFPPRESDQRIANHQISSRRLQWGGSRTRCQRRAMVLTLFGHIRAHHRRWWWPQKKMPDELSRECCSSWMKTRRKAEGWGERRARVAIAISSVTCHDVWYYGVFVISQNGTTLIFPTSRHNTNIVESAPPWPPTPTHIKTIPLRYSHDIIPRESPSPLLYMTTVRFFFYG